MANFLDMQCPKCGRDDRIDILASVWVRIAENGTDADKGHSAGWDYEPHSPAMCMDCGHAGRLSDFEPEDLMTGT